MYVPRGKRHGAGQPDWPAILHQREATAASQALRRFYARGSVSGECRLAEVPLVALDLETTGLHPERHSIVSFGLIPFTLKRIHCRASLYQVIQPRRDPDPDSIAIHHITHSEMADAPDIVDRLDRLLDALAGRIVVVHYRAIERGFLNAVCQRRLGEGLVFPVIDTMDIEARLHPRRKPGLLGRWLGRKPISLRLAACRARYGLPAYRAHHALTDALATAELFQAQVAHHFSADTPVGELWS
jgi:DNA polymerase III subunit epsilon